MASVKQLYARALRAAERAARLYKWRGEYVRHAERGHSLWVHANGWRRGFLPQSLLTYNTTDHAEADFLSDYERYVLTAYINGPYGVVLDDKYLYHRMMHQWSAFVPHLFGVLRGGAFVAEHPTVESTLGALLRRQREAGSAGIVIKPATGGEGQGIRILRFDGGERVCWNRQPLTIDEAATRATRAEGLYVVTELVEQADYAAAIYPQAANTVRIIMVRDPDTRKAYLARATHRFGSASAGVVDNFAAGGASASVDMATGKMGPAVQKQGGRVVWHAVHPDTQSPIDGVIVPGWSDMCATLRAISDDLPFLKYIGWDVLMTPGPAGSFRLIEGNSYPGVAAMQIHGPLLADPRVRRFYEAHGVR